NTTPDKLEIHEAAVLVGLLKAPSFYSPIFNPDNSRHRRNIVLSQMEKYKYLSREEYEKLKNTPLSLKYNIENHNSGIATYFRSVITNYLMAWCKERGIDLYGDGLKIYST